MFKNITRDTAVAMMISAVVTSFFTAILTEVGVDFGYIFMGIFALYIILWMFAKPDLPEDTRPIDED